MTQKNNEWHKIVEKNMNDNIEQRSIENDNIGWRRTEDEGERMKASGWRQADEDR
jgi:hypothetical protein